jgi:PII-like signaling protein
MKLLQKVSQNTLFGATFLKGIFGTTFLKGILVLPFLKVVKVVKVVMSINNKIFV